MRSDLFKAKLREGTTLALELVSLIEKLKSHRVLIFGLSSLPTWVTIIEASVYKELGSLKIMDEGEEEKKKGLDHYKMYRTLSELLGMQMP